MEPEVKTAVDAIGRAFEEFKSTNDARLAKLEKTGVNDAEYQAKLAKLETVIQSSTDVLTQNAQALEAKVNKLALGGEQKADGLTPEQREYKRGLDAYYRKGNENGLGELQIKAMLEGSEPGGGYLVTPDTSGRIVTRVYETSPIRQFASVQAVSSDALDGLSDQGSVTASWVGETGTRSESTAPTWKRYRVPVHEMYVQPAASQTLLDQASMDVEMWLAAKVADAMSRAEATAFITGTGVSKPRGITTYTTAATADASRTWGQVEHVATGTQASFGSNANGADKLMLVQAALNPVYRPNARWFMTRNTLAQLRQIKNSSGLYAWLPDFTQGTQGQILGDPVTTMEDMPAITAATDTLSIGYGDLKGYQIVDGAGIRVLRDPFTSKPYVLFYTTRRVGGELIDFNSIKFLKFATS